MRNLGMYVSSGMDEAFCTIEFDHKVENEKWKTIEKPKFRSKRKVSKDWSKNQRTWYKIQMSLKGPNKAYLL